VKAAVLGAGGMGGSVIRHLQQCPEVDEVIAYDIRPERLRRLADQLGVTAGGDLDAVLGDADVRVAFVTASNDAHRDLTIGALRAGKAVLCEKPMATTLADAGAMVDAAEQCGGFLQVGFECRYSTAYRTVKQWIDDGLLGRVVNTQCTYICSEFHGKGSWRNRTDSGGSMFGEKLSHYVDLPRWWIGSPVTEVYSACAPNVVPYYEVRDNYHTTYRFADGAVSELTFMMAPAATFDGDPLQDLLDQQKDDGHALTYLVVGTGGAAAVDVFRRRARRWQFGDSPKSLTSTLVQERTWSAAEDQQYFHNTLDQTRDVVRRVAGGLAPATAARDAYETMRVCFAADRSADTGRVVRLEDLE